MSESWYLTGSQNKYLSGYENELFDEAPKIFDELLQESPEAEDVLVEGIQKRIIVQSNTDLNKRKILFRENDVKHGNIVEFKNNKWLTLDLPYFNKMYERSIVAICNETLQLQTSEGEKTQVGTDAMGRPVYETSDPVIEEIPAVIEAGRETVYQRTDQINIPEGRINVYIPYNIEYNITLETKFNVFNDEYVVYNLDYSKVYNAEGVLTMNMNKTS